MNLVRAGQPQLWLSVLVPFNEGQDAAALAGRINTNVEDNGTATATIGELTISIDGDGSWSVMR